MLQQKISKILRLVRSYKRISVAIILLSSLALFLILIFAKTQSTINISYQSESHQVNKSFEVNFSQYLSSVEDISIFPEIKGSWTEKKNFLGVTGLVFEPEADFRTDTEYTVQLEKVNRLITGKQAEISIISFKTEKSPDIKYFSIENTPNNILPADHEFKLELSAQNRSLRKLKLVTQPNISFDESTQDDITFAWKPKKLLPQGKFVTIVVRDEKNDEVLVKKKLKVAREPVIEKPVQEINFGKNDKAKIIFSDPVIKATADIIFNTKGKGEWQNNKTYIFKPEEVKPGKTYKYVVKAGLRTENGGILKKDKKLSFSTPGSISALSSSPRGFELSQAYQEIRFNLNQHVNRKSAEKRFHISSGEVRSISWQDKTLVAKVENLGFQKNVTAWLDAGIEPVFGLPSESIQSLSFTTEIRTIKLSVPYYKQVFAQSCEAASVRMALEYKGIKSNDWSILQRFGYKPKSRNFAKNIWDDPQKLFVGDVNGSQSGGTGWGVYSEPVAKAVRSFGRSATTHYGPSMSFISSQIHKNRPVIVWGIWGSSAKIDSWKTPEGKTVSGPIPMHVRLVVGVKGEPSNPVGFYINDPITGSEYWSVSRLAANMSAAGPANQAVVIY